MSTMDASEMEISILEKRISALENRILPKNSSDLTDKQPIAKSLIEMNKRISSELSQRDKINIVMKRFDQLEEYLDPSYGVGSDLNAATKFEIILSLEQELKKNLASLEIIKKTQPIINSESFKCVPELETKLNELNLKYLNILDSSNNQNEKVMKFLADYNEIVTTFSLLFVQYDQIITECEAAVAASKQKKRNE